jgi:phage gp29-like protein
VAARPPSLLSRLGAALSGARAGYANAGKPRPRMAVAPRGRPMSLRELGLDPPAPLPEQPPAGQQTQRDRGADTFNGHPGSNLAVDDLLAILRRAEQGWPIEMFDLFDDTVEFDGHLRGLAEGRIQAVASKEWILQPGGEDTGSRSAARDLFDVLRTHAEFAALIEWQQTSPLYGIAFSELGWGADATRSGLIVPSRMLNVAHRRFASLSWEKIDELGLIQGDARQIQPLRPGSWAVTQHRSRNPWTGGLLRTAVFWALFKRWAVRDWQVFADMFGLPMAIGHYEPGNPQATREALISALEQIGEDGYAVLAEGAEIMLSSAARNGDATSVYPAIVSLCEAQMSKLITGATLTTDAGGTGAYALGTVHETRGFLLALADARRLEQTINRAICEPFVRWNGYGGRALPPRFRLQIVRELSLEVMSRIVVALAGIGLRIDETWLYDTFGIGRPAAGGGLLAPAAQPKPEPKVPSGASLQLSADDLQHAIAGLKEAGVKFTLGGATP